MARVKRKDTEDFSHERIEKVIVMLDNGETKKACCEYLGMTYNTARLNKLIEEYLETKANRVRLRKKMRNQPLEKADLAFICQNYLDGMSLSEISESLYRTTRVIKNVLERYNIPLRDASNTYFNPIYLEETPNDYSKGDLVYSARYNSIAEIVSKYRNDVYHIALLGDHQQYAYQPYYELSDLRKLQRELGISGTWQTDTRQRAWQAVVEGNKRKSNDKE